MSDCPSPIACRRREEAVSFARASIGLERFKPSKEDDALAKRFIDGEIDPTELVQVLAPKTS
jgi:hypothetical protein